MLTTEEESTKLELTINKMPNYVRNVANFISRSYTMYVHIEFSSLP